MNTANKIKTRNDLIELRKSLAKDKKVVVFTNGCFDILHRGHVEYLEEASQQGDVLIVGINSDQSTNRLKGKGRPIIPEEDRAYILASLSSIDYVCIFNEDTPLELIKIVQPDVLVKGADYNLNEIVGRDFVEKYGGKVLTIPLVPERSTTEIIHKMINLLENEKYGS